MHVVYGQISGLLKKDAAAPNIFPCFVFYRSCYTFEVPDSGSLTRKVNIAVLNWDAYVLCAVGGVNKVFVCAKVSAAIYSVDEWNVDFSVTVVFKQVIWFHSEFF